MAESEKIRKLRAYISSMPSLPTTVAKVLEVCNNPRTSPIDLDKVISLDPVLMGKVLKLINSAYYGLQNKVTSLVRAIIMLGVNTVKNLALSTAVLDRLVDKNGFRALNMEGFWRHSLCVGVVAKMLASQKGVETTRRDEYFAAGLLHDIGKIPMNNVLSEDYIRAMGLADMERIPLYLAEKRALDIDHAEVGGMIAEAWHLDGPIADAIRYHHEYATYEGPNLPIVLAVAVADYYASREGVGFSGCLYPEKLGPEVYEKLGVPKVWLEGIDEAVTAAIEKASIFLKIK
ncbi:MAG: phosphohydrolase [Spirochaetes bacterium RIFOXYC1_FULL_54_7]|nr:MAG: phosphohydrolase [Spirochaetes bacterium RIFOXYC1_FULL_54_7]